jgi:hypothetical protein
MTKAALPGDVVAPAATAPGTRPPMPSIRASALHESQLLVALARRTLATWLTRG